MADPTNAKKRKPARELFACPNCGADVPVGASACKECGSDATTGWRDSQEIDYASVDLPDGYRDDARGDELPAVRTKTWIAVTALVLAAVLVAAIVMGLW
jgi:ribosomal protein L40E